LLLLLLLLFFDFLSDDAATTGVCCTTGAGFGLAGKPKGVNASALRAARKNSLRRFVLLSDSDAWQHAQSPTTAGKMARRLRSSSAAAARSRSRNLTSRSVLSTSMHARHRRSLEPSDITARAADDLSPQRAQIEPCILARFFFFVLRAGSSDDVASLLLSVGGGRSRFGSRHFRQ
jgi:LmbE family N-acetylglucosaminyl deacetylase